MTTEEKAKAYDEAIKRAKPLMLDTNFSMKNTVISIFPELNESEDDRIMKAIMEVLKRVSGATDVLESEGTTFKKAMIWFEKQKAKERLDRMAPIYNDKESFESALEKAWKYYNESVSRTVDSFEDDYIECVFSKGFREGFLYKEKQKEQKPAEWSEDWREEDIQTRFAFYTYKDDPSVLYLSNVFVEETSRNHGFGTRILRAAEKVAEAVGATTIRLKVKQNSHANAWYRKNGYGYVTFEDGYDWLEKNLEYIKPDKSVEWSEKEMADCMKLTISAIEYDYDAENPMRYKLIHWLKSLRPQPKQEWSEKDNIMFENIILCLKEYCLTDEIKWLKSLRPQPKQQEWRHYTWHNQMRFDYGALVKYENGLGYEIVISGNKPTKEVNGEYIFLKDICPQPH